MSEVADPVAEGWRALVDHLVSEHGQPPGVVGLADLSSLQGAHAQLHGIPDLLARPEGQVWTSRWHPPTSGIVGTPEEMDYGRWLDDVWHSARTDWTSFCHDGYEHERCDGYVQGDGYETWGETLCFCPCHDGGTAGVWSHGWQDEGRRR